MPNRFSIKIRDGSIFMESSQKEIASLKIKEWETNFFKRKFGTLSILNSVFGSLACEGMDDALDSILMYADKNKFDLVELHLNVLGINLVPALEDRGFRLVDTRITFLSLMQKEKILKNGMDFIDRNSKVRNHSSASEQKEGFIDGILPRVSFPHAGSLIDTQEFTAPPFEACEGYLKPLSEKATCDRLHLETSDLKTCDIQYHNLTCLSRTFPPLFKGPHEEHRQKR